MLNDLIPWHWIWSSNDIFGLSSSLRQTIHLSTVKTHICDKIVLNNYTQV